MIHISKTKKGQFIVVNVSDSNGRVLNASEPFKTKRSAISNILAVLKGGYSKFETFQDNTLEKPTIFGTKRDGVIVKLGVKPKKPYVPGKK